MSASLKINPASISAFRTALSVATQKVVAAANVGMGETSSQAFAAIQAKTPRVTGALSESGQLANTSVGNQIRRTISYGNSVTNPRTGIATSEYAPRVHEVYNPEHPNSYKWIELTLREYGRESFMRNLASSLRSAL